MLPSIPRNPLIDLVCYDNKIMGLGGISYGFQIGFRMHRAGRVLGGINEYCPGTVGDGILELFFGPAEVILLLQRDATGLTAGDMNKWLIADKTRVFNQNLVSSIDYAQKRQGEGLFDPHGGDNFSFPISLQTIVP